jgi:hypothetical protein
MYAFGREKLVMLWKIMKITALIIVVIFFVRMYIQNRRIHSEAVATVTEVTNDDMMGGYSQKLTLEYTYDGKKYVIEDLQTINLQAEKGDMYTVHFSYRTPDKLKFIQPDDKVKNKRK